MRGSPIVVYSKCFPSSVCLHKTVKQYKTFKKMAYQTQKCPMEVEKQNKFQCIFSDTIFCICDLYLIYNDMAIDLKHLIKYSKQPVCV